MSGTGQKSKTKRCRKSREGGFLDASTAAIPRSADVSSLVIFVQNNETPHIASCETHQRSNKISIAALKRLLQQYLPKAEVRLAITTRVCGRRDWVYLRSGSCSNFSSGVNRPPKSQKDCGATAI
jgi:hypothetical protein